MIFQLDIPIYNTNCLFILEPTKEEMDEFLNNENNLSKLTNEEYKSLFNELDNTFSQGYTTTLNKGSYLIILKDSNNPVYYLHELFHLANFILWDRGVELNRGGEAYAYLIG